MSNAARRLDRLQKIWPREPADRLYLSVPALYHELRDVAEGRARRRLLAPGQPAEVAWAAWHRLNEGARHARTRPELEALEALVRDLGVEAGVQTWVEEAVAIGPMFEGETGERCWRLFLRAFASYRAHLDRGRAKDPIWQAEHPDWRPEMPDDGYLTFEWGLLARLEETWAAYDERSANR